MKKIGMIVAMDKELKEFFASLGKIEKIDNAAYDVYSATAYGKQLYIVKSGVGEIAAAGATQFLITACNVDVVLNFGICGKISQNLKILDTVVVDRVVHYQFDTSAIDNVKPGVYMFDGNPDNSVYLNANAKLVQLVVKLDSTVQKAICASGDLFVEKKEDKDMLKNEYAADVCEMEAAAILITCLRNKVDCLMVKSVSDDCDGMDFVTYCELAAAKHVELINKIVKAY
ncbi:MAG: 5'-methylthioadenosine/S-adenosylhomocysteine nucleosidase [Clostridia bacterium]|nr:5'-methylthioadenosine/S-adenosylhomocysteine nucleosidase [Clostridia bacterium]